VVIDRGVQVVEATSTPVGASVGHPGRAAMDAVATTGGDTAQLLDIQVDQVTGMGMLVAADHPAGGAVQPDQPVDVVADQDAVDGGGRQAEPGGDPGRPEPFSAAQPDDALLQPDGSPARAVRWNAGTVDQPGLAELLVAGPPAVGGSAGDAHLVGDVGDRPPWLGGDPLDQGQSSDRVRRALAWAMKPPSAEEPSDSPHLTRRLPHPSTTSMGSTPRATPGSALVSGSARTLVSSVPISP
jgi:hypothetical protein